MKQTYEGACHCGKVRFRAKLTQTLGGQWKLITLTPEF